MATHKQKEPPNEATAVIIQALKFTRTMGQMLSAALVGMVRHHKGPQDIVIPPIDPTEEGRRSNWEIGACPRQAGMKVRSNPRIPTLSLQRPLPSFTLMSQTHSNTSQSAEILTHVGLPGLLSGSGSHGFTFVSFPNGFCLDLHPYGKTDVPKLQREALFSFMELPLDSLLFDSWAQTN